MGDTSARTDAIDTVAAAVNKTAADPMVPGLDNANKAIVTSSLAKELVPMLLNATNNEPFWQSRVLLGSVTAILTSGFAIAALIQSGSTDATLYAPPIIAIAGSAFAIYGRFVATKPIGS